MTPRQLAIQKKIYTLALNLGLDPAWCQAMADQESTMGLQQVSPTGARGTFQMTGIAMKDLLQTMGDGSAIGDTVGIVAGMAFLALLFQRYGSIEAATAHYCDPAIRDKYVASVMTKMKEYGTLHLP